MEGKRKGRADYSEQKKAFDFLLEKYNRQELFTEQDLEKAAGWNPEKATFHTYFTKQFEGLLNKTGDKYSVSQLFLKYNKWKKFRDQVVTQNRILKREYEPSSFENVVKFEFFMPLRNEADLRMALDSLFFKDTIKQRIQTADQTELKNVFPRKQSETDEEYLERIYGWISDKFGGYSIGHYNGRFRADTLKSKKEVYEAAANLNSDLYLVDETTAIVLFIIPCGPAVDNQFTSDRESAEPSLEAKPALEAEIRKIRWFFHALFVSSILELVNGEDQIWLLETGVHNKLHIWKAKEN